MSGNGRPRIGGPSLIGDARRPCPRRAARPPPATNSCPLIAEMLRTRRMGPFQQARIEHPPRKPPVGPASADGESDHGTP